MRSTSPLLKKLLQGLTAGGIGFVLALALWIPGWLDTWEGKAWDWRVNLLAKPGRATDTIRLVLLDQNSLEWGKKENSLGWPWPRRSTTSFSISAAARGQRPYSSTSCLRNLPITALPTITPSERRSRRVPLLSVRPF